MTELELLKSTRKRLSQPEAWVQEMFAAVSASLHKEGFTGEGFTGEVDADDGQADCWCVTGSLLCDLGVKHEDSLFDLDSGIQDPYDKAEKLVKYHRACKAIERVIDVEPHRKAGSDGRWNRPYTLVQRWQDHPERKHSEVIEALDMAIVAEEKAAMEEAKEIAEIRAEEARQAQG